MSRRTPSPSASALRMRKHLERRQQGLQPLPQAWDWITAAEARDLVTKAFRSASWSCREQDAQPRHFAEALVDVFEMLVNARAEGQGHPVTHPACEAAGLGPDRYLRGEIDWPAMAERNLAAVPDDWRHQYPRFADQLQDVTSDGIRGPERSVGRGRSAPAERSPN